MVLTPNKDDLVYSVIINLRKNNFCDLTYDGEFLFNTLHFFIKNKLLELLLY